MMLKQIYRLIAAMICLTVVLTACVDEREKGQMQSPQETEDELVTLTFRAMVPGMTEATRVVGDGSVDEYITQMELYLFDHKNGFTGVVTADPLTHNNQYSNTVEQEEQYTSSGEYNANIGTYQVTIPKNTTHIHFLANYDREEEGFDIEEHIGRTETEMFGPLVTQKRIYWGRATATFNNSTQQMTIGQNPIVLYRNYAKIRVGTVDSKLKIHGWVLYRQPTHSSVPPFDASKIDHNPNDDVSTNPFTFDNLADLKMTPPVYALRTTQPDNDENRTDALANISKYTATAAHWMFEYDDEQYRSATDGQSNRVFAIFKIGYKETNDATEDVRLYKIELLKTTGEGVSETKTPYDIVRNWQYTINFNGITPDFGIPVADADAVTDAELEQVINALPANNNEVSIEKALPEVVSTNYTLRVEDEGEGSTIRYYKTDEIAAFTNADTNTDGNTLYTVNDITIYYNGANDDASKLTATWEDGEQMEGASDAITLTSKGNNLFTLSFNTTNFTDSETTSPHYKWGRIRISENVEGLLTRYVKVYIGPSVTFRPLLYSSDIPNLVDERLTVLFSIPGTEYLPSDLYPIEVRFGSDRVDVERNNEVASMKVDVANSATDVAALDYEDVLRWRHPKDNTSYYGWTPKNTDGNSAYDHIVKNAWGYEYVYTIENPAESGQKRITLRTVNKSFKDFRVMMEGRSTVTNTPVFNTRELFFQMQNNGTSYFWGGTWNEINERGTASNIGTSDQYNRIMLEGGMPETRYATAYVNAINQQNTNGTGTQDVSITFNYDLGTYDTESKAKSPTAPTAEVKLWAYYDKSKLTPTGITAGGTTTTDFTEYTDVEGNTFIRFTHGTGSSTGTLSFTAKGGSNVQNSMIFLTARNTAKYGIFMQDMNGTYSNNAFTSTYCGENALAQSYRSAGAIINIRNSWDFNPAPSLTGTSGSYSFATSIAMDYGKDKALYLRIDRPANTDGVKLTLDTQGKFKLLENTDEYTISSSDDTNGKYTITLTNKNSEYCYLQFQSLQFQSEGTITMTSSTDNPETTDVNEASTVPYNLATLDVTNNAISFVHFQFANEEDMSNSTVTYYEADADKNIHRTLYPIKGAQVGVRVYFPSTMTSQGEFRFRLSSNCFKVVDNGKTVNDVDAYSVENYSGTEEDQLIIKTTGSALTTATLNNEACAYLDILLQSTCIASTESVKFLGAGGADDFHFYPYIVGLLHDGEKEYTVEVVHQKDGMESEFISKPLTDVGPEYGKSIITYRLTLPNLGNRPYTIPVKVIHHGYFKDINSDKVTGDETKYKYISHDDTSYNITVDTKANEARVITFSFEIDTTIPTGTTIPVTFDIGGDVVKLTPNPTILKLADLLPIEATLSISTDGGNSYVEIADEGTYLNIPTSADQSVKIKITPTTPLDSADEFTIDMLTRGLAPNNSTHPTENCTEKKDLTDHSGTRIAGYTITGVTSENTDIIVDLKTKAEGTAETITLGGKGYVYLLPDFTLTIASHIEGNFYDIHWNAASGANKGGVNQQIFDNDQFQNFVQPNETYRSNFNTNLYSKYVEGMTDENIYGVKFDSRGLLSFYAPKDNMTLTIVGTGNSTNIKITEVTGIASTENDKNQYGVTYAGEVTTSGDFDADGETYKISLGKSGLYTLTSGSGQTQIFYLRLAPQEEGFSSIAWTANTTSSDLPAGRGTTTGTITDNKIVVSDFNETLTLNIPDLTGETNVVLKGDYTFNDGTKMQTVTPDGEGKIAVTIKPNTAKAIDSGELVDGTFSLNAYTADYEYVMENVEVYIRPYVIIDGLINAGNGYINVGETFNVTVTIPDDINTVGKDVAFSFPWAEDGSAYISSETVPTEYQNEGISKENVIANKIYTFTWKVHTESNGTRMILSARNGGNTDIVRTLNQKGIYNKQNFWPYLFTVEEVKVGLGTWQSTVVYENIVVKNLSNNETVYTSESSISSNDWLTTTAGLYHDNDVISYSNNQLSITDNGGNGASAILDLPVHAHNYQISCRAKKTSGDEGFLILFDYNSASDYKWWNIGGWGNEEHSVQINGGWPDSTSKVESGVDKSDNDRLVESEHWYNITIQINMQENNKIATCTCEPETTGDYYMKYVYNLTTGERSTELSKRTAVYEYYITDNSVNTTERYKHVRVNGVQQTAEIDILKMNGAYTYRTDGGTNNVTLYDGTSQSLPNGEHMGGNNQYISLHISYHTTIYYKWVPRYNNTILSIYNSSGEIISNNPTSTTAGTFYEVTQELEPGTYTLKSGNSETVLWYLRLTPISSQ